jgi:hypothetical protein
MSPLSRWLAQALSPDEVTMPDEVNGHLMLASCSLVMNATVIHTLQSCCYLYLSSLHGLVSTRLVLSRTS